MCKKRKTPYKKIKEYTKLQQLWKRKRCSYLYVENINGEYFRVYKKNNKDLIKDGYFSADKRENGKYKKSFKILNYNEDIWKLHSENLIH